MKKNPQKSKYESGATTVEAVTAVLILVLVLFGMLQIYHWCMTKQYCQYAAFYACKSMALGFKPDLALRAARVAAINISGQSDGEGDDDEDAAKEYMTYGDASGVRYDYWHSRMMGNHPTLMVWIRYGEPEDHSATVELDNSPLLHESISKMFFISKTPSPKASVSARNYSKVLMED